MPDRIKFNDEITVGAQPSAAEIKAMASDGFRGIMNLRTYGEDMQEISPDQEEDIAREAGMEYIHIPVSMKKAGPELVDRFREEFRSMPKPVFVHCKLGKRAGAFVMMHTAAEQGMSGEDALKKAEEMGFECDQEEMKEFVKNYLSKN